jgi:hypothetical protein
MMTSPEWDSNSGVSEKTTVIYLILRPKAFNIVLKFTTDFNGRF